MFTQNLWLQHWQGTNRLKPCVSQWEGQEEIKHWLHLSTKHIHTSKTQEKSSELHLQDFKLISDEEVLQEKRESSSRGAVYVK